MRGLPRSLRRLRRHRTDYSSSRWTSPVHSARVGAEVEVHYRWHALFGRRLRLQYSEVRAGAPLSFVEAGPGVVIVMPSWMLDPAACADTTLGEPQVDCAALKDLSRLLIDRGFRRSSSGEVRVAEEEPNEALSRDDRSKAETRRPTPTRYRVRGAATVDDAAAGTPEDRLEPGQPPAAGGGRRPIGGGRR